MLSSLRKNIEEVVRLTKCRNSNGPENTKENFEILSTNMLTFFDYFLDISANQFTLENAEAIKEDLKPS